MNILGLMGSPRIGSNTDTLLDHLLKGAESQGAHTEKLTLISYTIKPCIEIYECRNTGHCPIKDDFEKVLASLYKADAIVLASPIFFYSLPSHTKALIDRCQSFWCARYILQKRLPVQKERKGYFAAVGASKGQKLFEGVKLTVKYFFDTLYIPYVDELLMRGIDEKGAINHHPTVLDDAFSFGVKIAQDIRGIHE